MLENIIFAVMVIIAAGAGIWVWWLENHGSSSKEVQTDPNTLQETK